MHLVVNNARKNNTSTLGANPFLDIAAGALGKKGGTGGGPAAGASPTSEARATTVSPSFQQAFTPQFSPNLIMSTGSGGVTASATQVAPGGQTARTGSASARPPAPTGAPDYGPLPAPASLSLPHYPSAPPVSTPFNVRDYVSPGMEPVSLVTASKGVDWNNMVWPVTIGVLGIGALMYFNRKRRRA